MDHLDRFAKRLLERTNEDWTKWQLCRYAEIAVELMCYGISRAIRPPATPESMFEIQALGAISVGLEKRGWAVGGILALQAVQVARPASTRLRPSEAQAPSKEALVIIW